VSTNLASTEATPPDGAASDPQRLTVGSVTCHVISDGSFPYDPGLIFANVPEETLSRALDGRLDEQGQLSTPYHCLVLVTPSATVLVDTGLGRQAAVSGAPAGHLLESLTRAGFSAADIDIVVLTHAHPDHIGGLIHDGQLTFGAARHVMSSVEWAFWTSEDVLAQLPEMLAAPARALLPPLSEAGVLDLTDGETELVGGVHLLPAPGHTPGHCVVAIQSDGSRAMFLADSVLDELQFAHPAWVSAVDVSAEDTIATRLRLLDDAARDDSLVLAYHMAGVGQVERSREGYRFLRT
jgi:glyoxylase-like metal-dependent hydrolase (beta-lactamase superfamily II)